MIRINLEQKKKTVSKLPFEGKNPDGTVLYATNRYLAVDGNPIFPIMGEFHYARYRESDWERELCKMKAGGVTIVATYVFWIHHEEEKGVWDFRGRRDLRRFVELCQKCGLAVLLRIGPWCHGECRNGGSPDWIAKQDEFPIRTDNEEYLFYVRRFFTKLEEQIHGLLFADGGPIVGVQIENEYRAYAEKDRTVRKRYMRKIKEMAVECGFIVPLYTATAWGTATLNEMETLPVLGGYADAPWENHTRELPENAHFLFRPPMNDPSIGSDLKKDDGNYDFDVDINAYPYLTAELGGGVQMTRLRRVVVSGKDTEALCVCKMGSGVALLGYYMYHGGTNPMGKFSTMEEYNPRVESNILPICSYDFQAVLRENGDVHESYHLTRRHHLFLQTFPWLSACETLIPADSASDPADLQTLRYAVRYDGEKGAGFVFLNNHCRKRVLADHEKLAFAVTFDGHTVETPSVGLKNDEIKYLPFSLPLGEAVLETSNATPLCNVGKRWFFYTDDAPVYRFAKGTADIVTLSEEQSRHAYRFGDSLWIADCSLYERDGKICAEFYKDTEVTVYRETGDPIAFLLTAEQFRSHCRTEQLDETWWKLSLLYGDEQGDLMLDLDFLGDRAEVFASQDDVAPIADWLACGLPMRVSLASLDSPKELFVKVYPYEENRYFDLPVKQGCCLHEAKLELRSYEEIRFWEGTDKTCGN